jgi:hypothetical protein
MRGAATRNLIRARLSTVITESPQEVSPKVLTRALRLARKQLANIEGSRRPVNVSDFVMISQASGLYPDRLLCPANGAIKF